MASTAATNFQPTLGHLLTAIEAVEVIRKGQVLGITQSNLGGQAWVFGALFGLN